MKVIKRSGEEVNFDAEKILIAITKANKATRTEERISDLTIVSITNNVVKKCNKLGRAVSVEEIQDMAENELMTEGAYLLAKNYITYRYERALARKANTTDKKILSLLGNTNEEVKQENSNKNPTINSTQRDYMAGEVSKDITKRFLLPADIWEAHEKGIIHFHDADYFAQPMYNCFSSKTKFVTSEGIRQFSECKNGEIVNVLDKDGIWRTATVRKYEKQILYDVTLKSNRSETQITCTKNHRWLLKDGSITTNLKVGDVLYPLNEMQNINIDDMSLKEKELFCFGFIIGDGTDYNNGVRCRLCGDKVKYAPLFKECQYTINSPENSNDVFILKANKWSKQSFLNSESWKYLNSSEKKALFLGLYAADGNKNSNGLSTSDIRILNMIKCISAIAGYHISSIKHLIHNTSFKRNASLYTIRFRRHQNPNNCWIVKKIEKHHKRGILKQDTWCVEEPITHTFTLSNGIVTGNCCLVNLEDMLQNGTVISGTKIEKPHSFSTACNIATQIIAQVASNQYGGQTITLSHLAPFVDISRQKYRKAVAQEMKEAGVEVDEEKINIIAEERARREITTGVQTIQYQIITLMTTNGQAPFVTVFMYLDEVPEGQTRDDLATIIEEMLKQRILGVKNEKGVYITPAFPKLIYCLDEDNIHEDSKYYYLTKLAAECTAKRMVPDYISAKIMKELKGDVYPCMGCRSFLTPDRFTDNGWENNEHALNSTPDKHKYYGRFNQGVVTINLVDIACSSNKNMDEFWKIFDERLDLCYRALMIRHNRLLGTKSDVAPILWQYGAIARLKKGETIDKLLYNGYSTISLGYGGLAECVRYMTGLSHTSPEGEKFGLAVMQHLNDACEKWKKETNIDFSVYGTPMESTTYKFAKCLQERFGIIEGVTDKNYITNSYHIHVTEEINAFDKLTKEARFQKLSPGGAISYVEVPNMQNNIQAVLAIMKHIYKTIMYAELNTKSDYCQKCGYSGEIQIVEDENHKLIWKCPNCGNTDQNTMNVARRTCGYIGTQFWNQGRTQEIKERVLHL